MQDKPIVRDTILEVSDETLNTAVLTFTPDESGTYVFNTTDTVGVSPKAALYDSKMNLLAENDGTGYNSNVFLLTGLEKGKDYVIVLTNDDAFRYKVKLEKAAMAEVTYDANLEAACFDGNIEKKQKKQTYVSGQTIGDDYPAPAAEGYTFRGWSTEKDAERTVSLYNTKAEDGLTLYGVWTQNVNVIFDKNNANASFAGGEPYVISCRKGMTLEAYDDYYGVNAPSVPEEVNLLFAGWAKSKDATEPDPYDEIIFDRDTTVYAVWKESVTVTFNANRETDKDAGYDRTWSGGGYVYQQTDTVKRFKGSVLGKTYNAPDTDNPELTFAGWAASADAEEPDASIVLDESKTVYAVWKMPVKEDILAGETKDVNYRGAKWIFHFVPEENGDFVFRSLLENDYSNVYLYNENGVYVSGSSGYNGVSLYSYNLIKGKNYYYYVRANSQVSFRVSLAKIDYAKVTLDSNRGENAWFTDGVGRKTATTEDSIEKGNYVTSDSFTAPETNEKNIQFVGWAASREATEAEEEIRITGDTTLYAVWKETAAVTFDVNRTDGAAYFEDENWNPVSSETQDYPKGTLMDTSSQYEMETRSGRILFCGWSVNKTATVADPDFELKTNTTLYAIWKDKAEIVFDANGGFFDGYGVILARLMEPDADFGSYYIAQPFSMDPGKTFAGWATTKDAKKADVTDETVVADLAEQGSGMVYAVWKNLYKVTFDVNGGLPFEWEDWETGETLSANTFTETCTEGDLLEPAVCTNEDPFMTFEGWFDQKTGGTKYDRNSVVTKDLVLYAHWKTLTQNSLSGETLTDASSDDLGSVLYRFIPDSDGLYVFNSADGRDYNPTVRLYDSTKKQIADNTGGSLAGNNFLLICELKGGQIYYYTVTNEKGGSFRYPLKIAKAAEITLTFDANRDDATIKENNAKTWQTKTAAGYSFNTNVVEVVTTSAKKLRMDGWSVNPEGSAADARRGNVLFRKDITLYAIWTELATVTFHIQNDRASFEEPYDEYDEPVSLVSTAKDDFPVGEELDVWDAPEIEYNASGKIFLGWSLNPDASAPDEEIMITGATDVYGVWADPVDYTTATGIALNETKNVDSGEQHAVWYNFTPSEDGVYNLESSAAGDYDPYVELYEQNGTDIERIESDDDGGAGSNFSLTCSMKAGKTYFFKNRVYGNGSGFRYRVTLTKPVTATVMLNLNRSDDKAVFNKNNRKEIQVTATVGRTLSVPEISFRDSSLSLCFLGWSTDPGATTGAESIRVTGNETYYAVWSTTVEVTFDANRTEQKDAWYTRTWDADQHTYVLTQTTKGAYRKGTNLPARANPPFTDNPDLYFLGWSVKPNATEPDETIVLDGSKTVYGVWATKHYVTFDANGGYFDNIGTVYTGVYNYPESYLGRYEYEVPVNPDPKKLFAGWATTPKGTPIDVDATKIKDCGVLYAQWVDGILVTLNANRAENPGGYFYQDGMQSETVTLYVLPGTTLEEVYTTARSSNPHMADLGDRALSSDGAPLPADTPLTAGATVYVRWTEQVDVTFDAGTGTIKGEKTWIEQWTKGKTRSIDPGFQATSGNEATVFGGWSTDGTAAGIVTEFTPTKATTLKAVYLGGPQVTIAEPVNPDAAAYATVNGTHYTTDDGAFTFTWPEGIPLSQMSIGGTTSASGLLFMGFSTTEGDGSSLVGPGYCPKATATLYPVVQEGYYAYFYAGKGSFAGQTGSESGMNVIRVLKGNSIGTPTEPVPPAGMKLSGWTRGKSDTLLSSAQVAAITPESNEVFYAQYEAGTATVEVTDIALSPAEATITEGGSVSLTPVITPSGATNKTVLWESSNRKIADVDSAGNVTGTGFGVATITATAHNGKQATAVITVKHNADLVPKKDSTCEETGNKAYYKCKGCDKVFEDEACTKEAPNEEYFTTPALGHDWDEWKVTKEPTETEDGVETRVCKRDANHKETHTIPAENHVHEMTKMKANPATKDKEGNIEYYFCGKCHNMYKDEQGTILLTQEEVVIPKLIDISGASITEIADVVYDGTKQTPKPDEVKVEGIVLKAGTDYTTAYYNNTDAGTATIIYTGIGKYCGTASQSFTIQKAASKVTLKAKTVKYNKKTVNIDAATVTGSKGEVTYSYFTDAACKKPAKAHVNAGVYYVTATVAEDSNYLAATSAAVKLTIQKIANPMKASGKKAKVSFSKLAKKKQTVKKAKAFKITGAQGKVTFKKLKGKKFITVNKKTGNITVKQGTGKGKYTIVVKVTAKGNTNYNAKTVKKVKVTIIVK